MAGLDEEAELPLEQLLARYGNYHLAAQPEESAGKGAGVEGVCWRACRCRGERRRARGLVAATGAGTLARQRHGRQAKGGGPGWRRACAGRHRAALPCRRMRQAGRSAGTRQRRSRAPAGSKRAAEATQ